MTDITPHSTLREWRDHMTAPVALSALGGAALILTIVAPYETGDILRVVPRFGYWLAIVVSTYSAGFLINTVLGRHLKRSRLILTAASAIATALAVAALVTLINGATLGYWPAADEWPLFFGSIFMIALVVAVVIQVVSDQQDAAQATIAPPALLDRLPFDKRAPLMALSVEDHYVRVRTQKAQDMILMRLSDAIREVGDTAGLQVHRSHWVALDAVASARREGDRAVLTLSDDSEIPVSRRYVSEIKKAGFLP